MFKNYLKTAFRTITNNKLFSLIKISSLAIGLSVSFVIGAMVYYDFTFDKFHEDKGQIYRVTSEFASPEGSFYNPGVAVPLGQKLKEGMPGIDAVAPFFTAYPLYVKKQDSDQVYKNPNFVTYADAGFFKIFKYKWLVGSPEKVLENPNEVVLTETRAKKYFPGNSLDEIVGNALFYNDTIPAKITGIVANFKKRTDIVFEEFISLKTGENSDMTSAIRDGHWNNTNSASQLFIRRSKNTDAKDIQAALDKLAVEHNDPNEATFGNERKFYMQPLPEMHFDENYYTFDFEEGVASKSVLISLSFIAVFLLLLGCINFINLNTAQATQRAKEIGIRKTLGSSKKQLVFQFLGETFLLTLAAGILSVFLSFWLLRIFSNFVPSGLGFELFSEPTVIFIIVVLLFIVTILSGFYPALVLSHFKPVSVLKNRIFQGGDKASLRKYLTVFQFMIAQIFVIATLLVGKQINYLMSKDMGFKTEAIASIRIPWYIPSEEKKQRFINGIKAIPQVDNISLGQAPPASFSTSSANTSYFGSGKEVHTELQLLYGDQNYLDLYGIELLAGRKQQSDSIMEYVINESYLKILGLTNPQDAIGNMLKSNDRNNPIVGVMKDFNQRSLKTGIRPLAFIGTGGRKSNFRTVHLALNTISSENLKGVTKSMEKVWKESYPNEEFELNFMDDTIKRFYQQERKTATLLNWATGLSIIISCLGLFGLVVYTTERRTKEIGIRKVLGASLLQLNMLLSREFLVLVAIAFVIAVPIAWFGLDFWLKDFAYKTNLSWWVFVLSGLAMAGLALLIMGVQTFSSARSNPVKSLRAE